jgi:hypothetical protein
LRRLPTSCCFSVDAMGLRPMMKQAGSGRIRCS